MAHPRESRVAFQPGRSHEMNPQESLDHQKISDEQRGEISQAFTLFDQDHDGYLDYHELKFGLKTLGFDLPKPRVYDLLTKNGVAPPWHPPGEPCPGPSLRITAQAFESIASILIANRDPREELSRAFDMFDQDGDGMITLEDLRIVNSTIKQGTTATDKDMANMIAQADLTGKGGVDREEFIDMMIAAKRRRGY